jgi:hypothetical protein
MYSSAVYDSGSVGISAFGPETTLDCRAWSCYNLGFSGPSARPADRGIFLADTVIE